MFVKCPICAKSVKETEINFHLDIQCSTKEEIKPVNSPLSLDTKEPSCNEGKESRKRKRNEPLAELSRPVEFGDFKGQEIVKEGSILRELIENDRISSMIFYGPPGSGKTTLARLISRTRWYKEFSATTHNIQDVKQAIVKAKEHYKRTNAKGVIFLDEIHRFTKAQQDIFLDIEKGDYIFIAATTENPSFRVNNALLSRVRVFVLEKLTSDYLVEILKRAYTLKIKDMDDELAGLKPVPDDVYMFIANMCDGDARTALNVLDFLLSSNQDITIELAKNAILKHNILYDRNGEEHYNIISALHKSLRGSDDNAALYWLGRMIYAGEDPLYVARRLVRFASEDIGLANNQALQLALSTYQACQVIGMPECDAILAHCVTYLARSPKSVETYQAIKKVKKTIDTEYNYPVPLHIRNAPTVLMKDMGYGDGYKYNPEYKNQVKQDYLPPGLITRNFFTFEASKEAQ
ncbi:Werner helicase interacting protein 1 [Boothiomyces macroporosus]|uniref:Werner helicase interacting protein 1 n=1 Tax=Boothiomyces macroporosus TaxID=261099 RepID=A0AAD5UI82_9FUNG|nr:Werner helicase interacting protein 1 [Boothiomyces macroporosus]